MVAYENKLHGNWYADSTCADCGLCVHGIPAYGRVYMRRSSCGGVWDLADNLKQNTAFLSFIFIKVNKTSLLNLRTSKDISATQAKAR